MYGYKHKPFPAKVNWLAVWKYRWLLLDLVNQIAHGVATDTAIVARLYGGSVKFGDDLYVAAREIIEGSKDDYNL